MEKVRPWCGQPSDRGLLKNRTLLAVKRLRRGGGGGAQDGTEGGSFARDVNCAAGRLRAERLQKLG